MLEFSTVLPIVLVAAAAAAVYFFVIKKKKQDDASAGDVADFVPDPTPVDDSPTTEEEVDMNKFAFIVGINHYSTPGMDLSGCVNDANNMREFLMDCCGFTSANIKMITDDNATKKNILAGLRWLVAQGAPGIELVYYHSGHGSQVYDASGDESDQLDEILIPHDHDWNDPLLDDYLEDIFSTLPQGAFLSMLCDTCHSGSMTKDIVRNIAVPKTMAKKMEGKALKRRAFGVKKDTSKAPQRHILLSGCQDDQTSSEAIINGVRQGAMTYNFIQEASAPATTWKETHANIVSTLKHAGWSQTPVLSGDDTLQNRIVFGRDAEDTC